MIKDATGKQNARSRWALELHLVQQWQNLDPQYPSVLTMHDRLCSQQTTASEGVQRIRDLPKQRMHERWHFFDFLDNPTPSCLYNLPTVTQLLILHIACSGFHGFNDRDANSLSWKRKESWYPPSAQDTKSTQYLTYLAQQSCEWSSIPSIHLKFIQSFLVRYHT